MVTAACQPSSRSELARCTAVWPPPTMSTPSAPGEPADVLLDCTLGIARRNLRTCSFFLNGQSYLQVVRCQRAAVGLLTGTTRGRILRTNRSVQITHDKDDSDEACGLRYRRSVGYRAVHL